MQAAVATQHPILIDVQACLANVDELLTNYTSPKRCAAHSAHTAITEKAKHRDQKELAQPIDEGAVVSAQVDALSLVSSAVDMLVLSNELLLSIFRYLDAEALVACKHVCRRFHDVIFLHEQDLFQGLCLEKRWLQIMTSPARAHERDWVEIFKANYSTEKKWKSGYYHRMPLRALQDQNPPRIKMLQMDVSEWGDLLDQL
eukprot:m.51365 g.51365  ORF g.51365 m.51365 type:complete len:201 (-) comp11230_c0_seq2:188-790(-)